jgi:four helix bundle protein
MYPYKKLVVWQRAHALAASLYATNALDESARYRGLVDQIRRCAASIAANIAEGAGSDSQLSFARYLGIALASAYELESHFLLARDIGCATPQNSERFAESAESLKRMLTSLRRAVKAPKPVHRRQNGDPK